MAKPTDAAVGDQSLTDKPSAAASESVKPDGIRIGGLQFLPSEGGISLLVPQAVIDSLAQQAVKQQQDDPALDGLTGALGLLKGEIYRLTGVQI